MRKYKIPVIIINPNKTAVITISFLVLLPLSRWLWLSSNQDIYNHYPLLQCILLLIYLSIKIKLPIIISISFSSLYEQMKKSNLSFLFILHTPLFPICHLFNIFQFPSCTHYILFKSQFLSRISRGKQQINKNIFKLCFLYFIWLYFIILCFPLSFICFLLVYIFFLFLIISFSLLFEKASMRMSWFVHSFIYSLTCSFIDRKKKEAIT